MSFGDQGDISVWGRDPSTIPSQSSVDQTAIDNLRKRVAEQAQDIETLAATAAVSDFSAPQATQDIAGNMGFDTTAYASQLVGDPGAFFNQDMQLSSRVPTINPTAAGTMINPDAAKYAMSPGGASRSAVTGTAVTANTGTAVANTGTTSTAITDTANAITGEAVTADTATAATADTGEAATADTVDQRPTATYDAATSFDEITRPENQMQAAQGQVREEAIITAPQADMQGLATGVNEDGTISYAGESLGQFANQNITNVIDTSTMSGKLLADSLGEFNYTDAKTTLQGQMDILAKDFVDPVTGDTKIPTWAASTARSVSRIAAFKGMTGTAATATMAQAIMEASLPIAQADAQFFQTLSLKNLDNKQQQTINTANVLSKMELANLDARMAAAVQNSKNFMQMDLANLNNQQQAKVINSQARIQSILEDSKAVNTARMFAAESINEQNKFYDNLNSSIDTFNASQRNAMTQFNVGQTNAMAQFNVGEANETSRFNASQRNAMTQFNVGQTNAMSQFNVGERNETSRFNVGQRNAMTQFNVGQTNAMSQFNVGEANETSRFNASQRNAMTQLNVGERNAMSRFNAELETQREQFYKEMQYNIDVANSKWRQTVTLQNSQMEFEAAATDVKNMVGVSVEQLNQLWDRSDALLDYAWRSSETQAERQNQIRVTKMQAEANMAMTDKSAAAQQSAANSSAMGSVVGAVAGAGIMAF